MRRNVLRCDVIAGPDLRSGRPWNGIGLARCGGNILSVKVRVGGVGDVDEVAFGGNAGSTWDGLIGEMDDLTASFRDIHVASDT